MSALQGKTAGGGGPQQPGQGGDPGGDSGAQYAQQVASLKGADPGMLLRDITEMKKHIAVMMVQNIERLPNVSGTLSKLIPQFDKVIKEISQAQNVTSAVRPPLGMGAAQPPMDGAPPGGL